MRRSSERRHNILAVVELAVGAGMLAGFMLLLVVPALLTGLLELPWAFAMPTSLPGFGLNPHHFAGARYVPSLAVLAACAAVAVCYRWLASRRRDS